MTGLLIESSSQVKPKILNCAAVSGVNLGDTIIAEAVSFLTGRALTLCDIDGSLADAALPQFSLDGSKNRGAVSHLRRLVPRFLKSRIREPIVRRRHSDLADEFGEVWIGGGNLLYDANCDNLAFSVSIARAFYAKGKVVKLLSVGVGPFVGEPKFSLETFGQCAEKVTARDDESRRVLRKYGVSSVLLIDPVWYLADMIESRFCLRRVKGAHGSLFGVNVMRPSALGSRESYSLWLKEVVGNIWAIAEKRGLVPVLIVSAFNGDPSVAEDIRRLMRRRVGYSVGIITLPLVSSTSRAWSQFLELEFILSHRMHVAISGLALGIPTVVFPWQHKISGVLESVFKGYSQMMLLNSDRYNIDEVVRRVDWQRENSALLADHLLTAKNMHRLGYANF